MTRPQPRDAGVHAYTGVLAAVALAGLAAWATQGFARPGIATVIVFSLAALATRSPIRFQRGADVQSLTVDDALLIVMLAVDPASAGWVLGAAALVAHLTLRSPTVKAVFNAAVVSVPAMAGAAVFTVLVGTAPVGAAAWVGAAVAGTVTYTAVNLVALGVLFQQLNGIRLRDFVRSSLLLNLAVLAANTAVGLLLALIVQEGPSWMVLGGLIMLGLHLGYRGYAAAIGERDRVSQLQQISMLLAGATLGGDARTAFLDEVASFFGARTAGFLDSDDAGAADLSSRGELTTPLRTVADEARRSGSPAAVGASGSVGAIAVPVSHEGYLLGVLAICERHGIGAWNETDTTLLATIANEAAVSLRAEQLLHQVDRERSRWQEESAKLNDILTAASDGIATFSADGRIASWNPGIAAMTGIDASHAVERPWWTVLRVRDLDGDDLLPEGDHVVTSALAGDRHGDPVSVQVLRRDGQWRWVRATFSPLVSDDGKVDGTVMVARDVTAEREVEELKADFVATVSHELRTPLTPLKGFLATVRQRSDMLTPDQIAMLHESMESQVLRLERLVNDLLVVADLDRGRIRFGRELVGLYEAVELARAEEQEPGEDRVRIVGDRGLAGAADGNAVVRILRALISNALKHSDGLVTVELARDGRDVTVRVGDDGPGIPPWEQERIFQRFHRLGDHLHRTQGPGLGLSIAKALTDHVGGSLEVDSDVGRGATFTLRLRAAGPVALWAPSAIEVG